MPAEAKRRRWWLWVALAALVALAWWLAGPRWIAGLEVERVDRAPGRVAVTFSVPEDLARTRERTGMGFIEARMFACDDSDAANSEVVTQRAGYRGDNGRVRQVASDGERVRYRAEFDDRLTRLVDHQFQDVPTAGAPGGLCFKLYGARMWFGFATSGTVAISTNEIRGSGR